MTARQLAAAAVLVLVLAHLAGPHLALVITVEVLAFALACVALGWLLAISRTRLVLAGQVRRVGR